MRLALRPPVCSVRGSIGFRSVGGGILGQDRTGCEHQNKPVFFHLVYLIFSIAVNIAVNISIQKGFFNIGDGVFQKKSRFSESGLDFCTFQDNFPYIFRMCLI